MAEHRQTVLIVDDAPVNLEVLNHVLGEEFEVLVATCGLDALDLAAREAPDLILLDVLMPELDGYEVCARLKADPVTWQIPVIFITALDQEADEARGLAAGAIDYVTKPFSVPVVRARVRNHMELKRYRDLLEEMAHVDGLTGIANRRRFDDYLGIEWRRGARTGDPLSLILADIDHFKSFNDSYGHVLGDECLRKVGLALAGATRRPGDLVARFGGEEFGCVLPETDAAGALRVANHLRESVLALTIPHCGSAVADRVTVSLGVATVVPRDDSDPEAVVRASDGALYDAKRFGRNQIRSR